MKYKKAERIMKIIELLTREQKPRTDDLASMLNVSERTVYRDLSTIANIMPIIYEEGYSFTYTPDFPDFKPDLEELMVMKLGLEISALSGNVKYRGKAKTIDQKFREIFKKEYKRLDETVGEEITVETDMYADYYTRKDIFINVEKAILERRVLEIRYYALYKNEETERVVNPYALIFKRHAWYMIAYCQLREDFRTFRMERIRYSKLLRDNFERDGSFSLEEYFKDAWEISTSKETFRVKIRFQPEIVPLLIEGERHPSQSFKLLVDGSLIYNVEVSCLNEIKRWILRFGETAEVLEPEHLREDMIKTAKEMLKRYER
jgi:predicted DNA-binding transcriptional regulator YafY